jgi:hypothetical protein
VKTSLPFALLLAAATAACGDGLASCGAIQILSQPSVGDTIAVGDTVRFYAVTASLCPDKVSRAIDFQTSAPAILGLGGVTDTTAIVTAVGPGLAAIQMQSRQRRNAFQAIQFFVKAPTP